MILATETMRKARHGKQVLLVYKLAADGQSLTLHRTITKGFLIGRVAPTQEGAPEHTLTVDLRYSPELVVGDFTVAAVVALHNPETGAEQRYQLNTNTPPTLEGHRYVAGLHLRANDARPVV